MLKKIEDIEDEKLRNLIIKFRRTSQIIAHFGITKDSSEDSRRYTILIEEHVNSIHNLVEYANKRLGKSNEE